MKSWMRQKSVETERLLDRSRNEDEAYLASEYVYTLSIDNADIQGGTKFGCLLGEWTTDAMAGYTYFDCSLISADGQTYWPGRALKSRFTLTTTLLWPTGLIQRFSLRGKSRSNLNLSPSTSPLRIIEPSTPSLHFIIYPTNISYYRILIRSFSQPIDDCPSATAQSCHSWPLARRKLRTESAFEWTIDGEEVIAGSKAESRQDHLGTKGRFDSC